MKKKPAIVARKPTRSPKAGATPRGVAKKTVARTAARPVNGSARSPMNGKSLSKPAARSKAPPLEGKPAAINGARVNGTKATDAVVLKPIAAKKLPAAKVLDGQPVAMKAPTAKANGKPVAVVAEATPRPANARPMLTQGPVAARPLTKKGTFAILKDPLPSAKPARRKVERAEPEFVAMKPPVAAVATSMKAAKNQAGMGQRDLEFFRDLLLHKRRELVGDMSHMEREALRENNQNVNIVSVDPTDQGTDAYEQEFTLGLVEKDRGLLREVNDALAKIQNGTYGICEGTGNPIGRPRLEAQPWARHSIEHARALEKRKMTFRR